MANWIELNSLQQLNNIKEAQNPVIIFKHSTRCPISSMAKKRFEGDADELPAGVDTYLLDLLKHRDISAEIADMFSVHHESPQMLLIKNGECVLDQSHSDILVSEIADELNKA